MPAVAVRFRIALLRPHNGRVDDLPQKFDFDEAEEHRLVADDSDAGRRLDQMLGQRLPEFSRASLQRLIKMGVVWVNGVTTRPAARLKTGDEICVSVPRIQPHTVEPEDIPLTILMDEPDFAVLDKPTGIAVHPGRGRPDGTLANAIAYRFPEASTSSGVHRPGIVHRLDMATSGVMVIAKTEAAHAAIGEAFRARTVKKEYRAIVYGEPAHDEDRIDLPLGRDLAHQERMAVRHDGGRESLTDICVIERFGKAAHLAAFPKTGRTHQIRVHLLAVGHPILGDTIYARGRALPMGLDVPRLMLHAFRLTFPHPQSGEMIEVEAPLPDDMQRVLAALRAN